jgi:hypothetical protein
LPLVAGQFAGLNKADSKSGRKVLVPIRGLLVIAEVARLP